MKSKNLFARFGAMTLPAVVVLSFGCGYSNNNMNPAPTQTSVNHLYVVNAFDGTISGFSIDATTGGLTSTGAAVRAGSFPAFPAATPDGKFLYVANTELTSSSVSGYTIDPASGALTPTTPAQFPISGDSLPLGITVDPASKHVYTANVSSISAFSIDPATGNLTELRGSPVFSTAAEFFDVKISPDGKFLFATDALSNTITTFSFTAAGLPVQVGDPVDTGKFPTGLVVDSASKFVYVANSNSEDISAFSIGETGALAPNGTVSAGDGCRPQEIAIDPDSKFVFTSCTGDLANTILRFNIEGRTGSLSPLQQTFPTGVNTRPRGLAVDPSGKFLFSALGTSNQVSSQSIDATGNLAPAGLPDDTGRTPIGMAISKSH